MADLAARGFPIPARLNLALLAVASAASAILLYLASHAESAVAVIACAIAFSFTANSLFSLLHEAVHGLFSAQRMVNEWAGRLAAAWFPTGLSIQRAFHLTHHRNNRSRLEQFDVLHDGDVKWLKYAQWYAILTGVYWAVAVAGVLAYLVLPRALHARLLRDERSKVAEQTSSFAYLAVLDELDPRRARLEILLSVGLQAGLFWALDLSMAGWVACYAAFALSWSSLQYTDHAFSPLDARDGAWNLRVGPVGRAFFLNYHSHLAHHRNSQVPWIHLDSLIVPGEPRPTFLRVWLEAWRGPRALDRFPSLVDGSSAESAFLGVPRGFDAFVAAALTAVFLAVFLVFFGGANLLSGAIPWRVEVALPFEPTIPFLPAAALVYLTLNLMLAMAPFVLRTWRELVPFFTILVSETIIAAAFFIALPVRTTFPERYVEGAIGAAFSLADALNLERNFFPSLHVAFAFTAALAYAPKVKLPAQFLLHGWAAAIAVATVLMHEHHVVDVVGGIVLAFSAWRLAGSWANRAEVLAAIDVELLCLRNLMLFGRRHPRYWLVALGLLRDSVPRLRASRVLRTGFCFLQQVDDLLDGDRPSAHEPLDVVDEVVQAIVSGRYGSDDLMRLAEAFVSDMRAVGGTQAIAIVLSLIDVMQRDRRRSRDHAIWTGQELREHHRATFGRSIDLMLIARRSSLRAADVPELIDALGWCSTMRDLQEDIAAGLVNVPQDVVNAARIEDMQSMKHDELVATAAVRAWIESERRHAITLLDATDGRLDALGKQAGVPALRTFSRSIRAFSRRRLPRLFPFLARSTAS
jgi:fatty acid desaturase/membrane-associated phospholipid phosphatase